MYPLFTSKDSPAERLPVAECHDTAPPASFNFDRYPAAMILPSAHVSARAARHAGHHAHGGQGGALSAAHHAGALALLFVHTPVPFGRMRRARTHTKRPPLRWPVWRCELRSSATLLARARMALAGEPSGAVDQTRRTTEIIPVCQRVCSSVCSRRAGRLPEVAGQNMPDSEHSACGRRVKSLHHAGRRDPQSDL